MGRIFFPFLHRVLLRQRKQIHNVFIFIFFFRHIRAVALPRSHSIFFCCLIQLNTFLFSIGIDFILIHIKSNVIVCSCLCVCVWVCVCKSFSGTTSKEREISELRRISAVRIICIQSSTSRDTIETTSMVASTPIMMR